jgi:hypothetical protein
MATPSIRYGEKPRVRVRQERVLNWPTPVTVKPAAGRDNRKQSPNPTRYMRMRMTSPLDPYGESPGLAGFSAASVLFGTVLPAGGRPVDLAIA